MSNPFKHGAKLPSSDPGQQTPLPASSERAPYKALSGLSAHERKSVETLVEMGEIRLHERDGTLLVSYWDYAPHCLGEDSQPTDWDPTYKPPAGE